MVKRNWLRSKLSATLLLVTASGCAPLSVTPPAEPERFPELPAQGRVSLVPTPLECSPTCLSGLTEERKRSLSTLTGSALPAPSVSGDGTVDYRLGDRMPRR